ncbi:MAG: CBS domain-containing protein, partial [Methanogenium sp.]|nr:CBS domain-containing protein [Methanogenium sp.]
VRHDISHLPVIENDGQIIGIINRQDLLNNLRI